MILVQQTNKFDKHVYDFYHETNDKANFIMEEIISKFKDKIYKSTLKDIDNEVVF